MVPVATEVVLHHHRHASNSAFILDPDLGEVGPGDLSLHVSADMADFSLVSQ